ncbi:hypothetical protein M413DRAFT_438799 [Hebeloma cylindrosporum]|uniref:Uncharacterized protein n=1 Tax=Hebeloma cylindrosporum TaxID=76867 RepID=A0A0C3CLS1_HEBCY|nr:hypothetical protein M413DRAFT_438799 [Hebeloma cylindrosporum h7]
MSALLPSAPLFNFFHDLQSLSPADSIQDVLSIFRAPRKEYLSFLGFQWLNVSHDTGEIFRPLNTEHTSNPKALPNVWKCS